MDAQFWIDAWNEGKTGFHQEHYNNKLIEYFSQFRPLPGQKVFVPLCGKTKDLLWLHEQGLLVHGVELYEKAVEEFFLDNQLMPFEKSQESHFTRYSYQNITISCGDFFKFEDKSTYDFIYDRASLVALPRDMRKTYSKMITECLKPGGKYLLIVYEYDQSKMDGPPFCVDENEINQLYQKEFTIKLMESKGPERESSRLSEVGSLKQKVYILEKKS